VVDDARGVLAGETDRVSPGPALWRVTERRTFAALRRDGRRGRSGPIGVTWLAPSPDRAAEPARAAFAVGRAVGGAVARNRVRRRLRAALRELATNGRLPAGAYLVVAGAEARTMAWSELTTRVATAVATATEGAST
jgi:ribonuclease P protein component